MLREVTGELAAEDIAPPRDLTSRIMSAVRAEVRRRDLLALPTPEPGGARISVPAVAAVLRFAADTVEGVRARHCQVSVPQPGDADSPDADFPDGEWQDAERQDYAIEVAMEIAVSYRVFTENALGQVRARVTAAAQAGIGLRLARLDLTVTDLYDG